MKKRIYIFVLLVLLMAALPELALAAAPSPVAIPVCGAQSHDIPYPTIAVDTGRANCLDDYPLPYPAADIEGDGISYFGRSTDINASAETESAMSPVPDKSVVTLMAFPFEGLNPEEPVADTTTASVELMAFPFEGLNREEPVADTPAANVELMAFPFEGLNPEEPVADTTTASVELMAFPFEGLNPEEPVADTPAANVELMAFPFEGLNPHGSVANPAVAGKPR